MSKKILLVDDEPEIITLMKRRLTKAGYNVLTANNGTEGLELAKKERPDIVILDVMMPGLSGYEICRILKMDPEYQSLKIILLTGRDQLVDKETSEQIKADAYVNKPFDPNIIFEKIKKLLNKKS